MKALRLVFLSALACLPTQAQEKSDRERGGLIGSVCVVAEGRFNKPPSIDDRSATTKTYTPEGRLLEIKAPSIGMYTTIERFERLDDKTVLLHRATIGTSNAEPLLLTSNPERDTSGNELYRIEVGTNRHYGREGDRVALKAVSRQETLKTRDRVVWRKSYLFDPQGRLVEEIAVTTTDLIVSDTLYHYDSLLAQAPSYVERRSDGITKYRAWYTYENDSHGNWIRRRRVKEEPSIPSSPPNDITHRTITYCS